MYSLVQALTGESPAAWARRSFGTPLGIPDLYDYDGDVRGRPFLSNPNLHPNPATTLTPTPYPRAPTLTFTIHPCHRHVNHRATVRRSTQDWEGIFRLAAVRCSAAARPHGWGCVQTPYYPVVRP